MSNVLSPPSSINDLRTKAHIALSGRLRSLDLTPLLFYTVTSAPDSILPYLVWQWDMSVPAPALEYFGLTQQTIITNALRWHQSLGTVQLLLDILTLCGFPGSSVLEGQNAWGGTTLLASQGWALFRVIIADSGAPSPTDLDNLTALINFFKPARCKLDSIIVAAPGSFADAEIPTGLLNGVNQVFTLADIPFSGELLRLYYNGNLLSLSDYTLVGKTVTLNFIPVSTDSLFAFYIFGGVIVGVSRGDLVGAQDGFNRVYGLTTLPNPTISTQIYRGGLLQEEGAGKDYTIVGSLVQFVIPPVETDDLEAYFRFGVIAPTPHYSDAEVPTTVSSSVYTLDVVPNPPQSLQLFRNGKLQEFVRAVDSEVFDYTLSGNTITYVIPLTGEDSHVAYYRF